VKAAAVVAEWAVVKVAEAVVVEAAWAAA